MDWLRSKVGAAVGDPNVGDLGILGTTRFWERRIQGLALPSAQPQLKSIFSTVHVKTDKSGSDLFGWSTPAALALRPRSRQAALGQFLTPTRVAAFLASLFPGLPPDTRLLDAGAGKGALSAAFVELWEKSSRAAGLVVHAYEVDEFVLGELRDVVARMNRIGNVDARVIEGDFVERAATMVRLGTGPRYTHAILNPPYRKIGTGSAHRALLRAAGLETVNLYSGFVGLALALLEKGGELVAIIPRSFCPSGSSFSPMRPSGISICSGRGTRRSKPMASCRRTSSFA